ncbi:hypothetical protein KUW00_15545 [Halomonas sp. DP5N14-9]|uniref:hypothetical protein n=1 Tax=Halomonas sp. DP5N14-9 TaxID=2859075 RepID=UPI001C98E87E|nr:hypothetical protein [Halomonas sp. DP5N14-9]MBY5942293.1 hypothetical protein [Halomonas sp. DP5N14-9]
MSTGADGGNDIEDTPEQRQLAAVAAEKWNFAQQELAPLEDAYMESVGELTSPGSMSYIAGRAMQGQQQAESGLNQQATDTLTRAGIDPSSGRFQTEAHGLALDSASTGGETLGRAQFSQESEQIKGYQNIIAMGQGEATQAQNGLAGLADQAAADARNESVNEFNRRSANLQLLGQAAGAATSYGMNANSAPTGGTATPGYEPGVGLDLYG